jgi:hypothetical protein
MNNQPNVQSTSAQLHSRTHIFSSSRTGKAELNAQSTHAHRRCARCGAGTRRRPAPLPRAACAASTPARGQPFGVPRSSAVLLMAAAAAVVPRRGQSAHCRANRSTNVSHIYVCVCSCERSPTGTIHADDGYAAEHRAWPEHPLQSESIDQCCITLPIFMYVYAQRARFAFSPGEVRRALPFSHCHARAPRR